ncbi:MAG: elongation factor Ts [Gammaproteobacteria bacterium]|nr:elongation factor Ts [Gammaproteobacteria bacterium]
MTTITATMVKELRERTGVGMMDCKKALVAADGDMELAIDDLRKSSGMKAAKKAGRIAADGLIGMKVVDGKGVMIEVNCETEFAARDSNFTEFIETVVERIYNEESADLEAMLENGLEQDRQNLIQKIGENISVRRAEFYDGEVASYVHTNAKIGVLVLMQGGDASLGRDIAMHIAAANPQVVSPADASQSVLAKEREIYTAQAEESGKPAEIIKKMVEGRVSKFLSEISLTEQVFVKNSDLKVSQLLSQANASVVSFVRYEVGEGIDKAKVDFADEVAQQLA